MSSYSTIEKLNEIRGLLYEGQWAEAQLEFKACNVNASEFTEWLDMQEDEVVVGDFALLGFYCRDYTPIEGADYGI